ncbi:MAG TPA: TIGR00730 family Rossman fold protein [Candidatus Binatia bacterium]|nr:TIGR00730 family Rossman fold protein [Candidatus Binatia bacterium]
MADLKGRICIFAGSAHGARPEYADAARALGRLLVERGYGLVYGGGNIGLMSVVADAVLEKRGEAVGVIPEFLVDKELAHLGLTELRVVKSMHERKAVMAELADGFMALPGGIGTLEEFFEVLSWAQLSLHEKPCGLLSVDGYYEGIVNFLDHAVAEGFLNPKHCALLIVEAAPEKLLDRFDAIIHGHAPKPFSPGRT